MSKKRVGEMSAPTWMLEGIRNGEYSKIVYDGTEYVLLKHGHWVFNGEPIEKWSHGNYCSVCGEYSETCGNYCPYCGAEMGEVTE